MNDLDRKRIESIESLLKGNHLSQFARGKLEARLRWLRSVNNQPELRAFAAALKARQGNKTPDLTSLYRRKSELDVQLGIRLPLASFGSSQN